MVGMEFINYAEVDAKTMHEIKIRRDDYLYNNKNISIVNYQKFQMSQNLTQPCWKCPIFPLLF